MVATDHGQGTGDPTASDPPDGQDGRVRQAAKRGLQKVYRSYRALDDEDTLAALIGELEVLAEGYSDPRRDHLLESKRDAELLLSSHGARLVEGVRKASETVDDG